MNSIEEAKRELSQLENLSRFEIMTESTAIFTSLLDRYDIKPIVVGGLAVEIYTRNEYTTMDIDIILSGRDVANGLFLELGFEKQGRYWYHPPLGISIEIPNDVLEDADYNKVIKLNLPSGRHVYVIGIEDIILDRLRACVHWKSETDCEWGFRMFTTHKDRLDIDYLKKSAEIDLTGDILDTWFTQKGNN